MMVKWEPSRQHHPAQGWGSQTRAGCPSSSPLVMGRCHSLSCCLHRLTQRAAAFYPAQAGHHQDFPQSK